MDIIIINGVTEMAKLIDWNKIRSWFIIAWFKVIESRII